ncbi:MAG: putative metal-dependent hydrolase, TIM-barrel fold [Rhodoferax sp.]|nr:putative metal-dependent hydrolase, TIM-barrel fold [Rhodoferax sp.]
MAQPVSLLPAGACDCHVHVIGPRADYPMVDARHYTPGVATHEDLRTHLARNGLARAVIVQPSVYGTDNRCMLDSLDRLQGAGRGIAVVDPAASDAGDASLRAMHARGVCGLRINVESAGIRDAAAVGRSLAQWAERIAPLGWHLQIYAALDTVAAAAPHIARLAVPVVLDHFAMLPAETPHTDARATAVLDLLRAGNAYVKLSAPYRMAANGAPDTALVDAWAAAFVAAAPERLLWGSDWPHTDREPGKQAHEVSRYRDMPHGVLTDAIARWLPDEALRMQVLVRNPAALYGF